MQIKGFAFLDMYLCVSQNQIFLFLLRDLCRLLYALSLEQIVLCFTSKYTNCGNNIHNNNMNKKSARIVFVYIIVCRKYVITIFAIKCWFVLSQQIQDLTFARSCTDRSKTV